jgi:protein tyrosine phosphatase (PTP) superfamily phosphohydrolase (DUF442 family)
MPLTRRRIAQLAALSVLRPPIPLSAQAASAASLAAPNVVPIGPGLITSGQPTAQALAHLGEQGIQAVIYLAPLTVPDAIADEPALLKRQGIEFLNIPITFDKPVEADFGAVADALDRWRGKKVLVHCQVNMRASSMVFLYRVIRLKEPPELAYEAVEKVWSPRGVWRELIVTQLHKHGVAFEPY